MLAVEPRTRIGRHDEELRAVRVRPRVGHRDRAADDLVVVDLVLERVAGPAGPGAGRVAALDHEVADDAVEDHPVIEALAGEVGEVRDRLRRVLVEEGQLDVAVVGVQDRLGHAPRGYRPGGWRAVKPLIDR